MDTKLKNNRKLRTRLAVAGILVISLAVLACFPLVGERVQRRLAVEREEMGITVDVNEELLNALYHGCYVLYMEAMRGNEQTYAQVYLEVGEVTSTREAYEQMDMLQNALNEYLMGVSDEFDMYRNSIDYCLQLADGSMQTNTVRDLENVFTDLSPEMMKELKQYYEDYFILRFTENGAVTVETYGAVDTNADILVKAFGQVAREDTIWDQMADVVRGYSYNYFDVSLRHPTEFAVAFGIPYNSGYVLTTDYFDDYWNVIRAYRQEGGRLLFVVSGILVAMWVLFMTSARIWKDSVNMNRPGKWYLMEAAVLGVFVALMMHDPFIEALSGSWLDFSSGYEGVWHLLTSGVGGEAVLTLLGLWLSMACCYGVLYLCFYFLRPVFSLGLWEYIRQYSLIYQIFPWLKRQWMRFRDGMDHIDFRERSTKEILQVVALNFVILMIISCFWFYGILILIIYSVILFFVLSNYYDRMSQSYQVLLANVNQIAEGRLDVEITADLGIFEPFKEELSKIRTGFKRAVDDEVKSERMKTELITNVSHDLKTPLTAILTYVELLKREDITEEERNAYIETLERKSLRLKVLIEDLFEVSKATSDNITLNLADVDVVNLMKQVSVEHTEAYKEAGLELRWRVPDEKVMLRLDSQKAYRIFENLFMNIQKYAMPKSRVYVDVVVHDRTEAQEDVQGSGPQERMVEIALRNMSEHELCFAADEITERFVRGDASRNTEGSGLGLAIAKSFAEAMGGSFHVEVDGDLFKVVIRWVCGIL